MKMNMKTSLGLGALVIVALSIAGIAYWIFGENSQPVPSGSAGAPPVALQASTPPSPPPSPSTPPATAQSNQPTPSPEPSPGAPQPAERGQAAAPPAPAAPTARQTDDRSRKCYSVWTTTRDRLMENSVRRPVPPSAASRIALGSQVPVT
jgi:hypothetical protein